MRRLDRRRFRPEDDADRREDDQQVSNTEEDQPGEHLSPSEAVRLPLSQDREREVTSAATCSAHTYSLP